MVAIQGLGGIPEPKPEQPSKVRKDRETASATGAAGGAAASDQDDVVISSEARAAAAVARIITQTLETSDVRAEKVAAARERLDRGDYKDPGNIAKTAGKLLKYLG